MNTRFLTTALVSLALAGPVWAQTNPQQQQQQEQQQRQQQSQLPPDSDSLIGKKAVGMDGQEVGSVSDVVVTPDGKIAAVVLEQGGGLGGGKMVALQWNQVKLSGDQLSLNMNQDQVSQLPEYTGTDQ